MIFLCFCKVKKSIIPLSKVSENVLVLRTETPKSKVTAEYSFTQAYYPNLFQCLSEINIIIVNVMNEGFFFPKNQIDLKIIFQKKRENLMMFVNE